MAYTEIKKRNRKKYFYRVISVRQGEKINKKRIYMGANLNIKSLKSKELEADKSFLNEKIRKNLEKIKPKIIEILKKYRVKRAGLFGSYTRGEQRKDSDIDILIEYPKGMGLNFVGIALDLEKTLKKKVDLLTYGGISPYLKKYILEDEVRIL